MDRSYAHLAIPVDGKKSEEIALGDAHHTVEPVYCKGTAGHPPANCPVGDIQRGRDIADREKARCTGNSSSSSLACGVFVPSHKTFCGGAVVCIPQIMAPGKTHLLCGPRPNLYVKAYAARVGQECVTTLRLAVARQS